MSEADIINLFREAIWTTILIVSPPLLVSMIIGLIISIIQTTTSIQEQTLTFVPKIIAILLLLVFIAPWITNVTLEYTRALFQAISNF